MRTVTFAIIAVVLLSGCATRWAKMDFDPWQFERDTYDCERDTGAQCFGFPSGLWRSPAFYKRCMKVHGYTQLD